MQYTVVLQPSDTSKKYKVSVTLTASPTYNQTKNIPVSPRLSLSRFDDGVVIAQQNIYSQIPVQFGSEKVNTSVSGELTGKGRVDVSFNFKDYEKNFSSSNWVIRISVDPVADSSGGENGGGSNTGAGSSASNPIKVSDLSTVDGGIGGSVSQNYSTASTCDSLCLDCYIYNPSSVEYIKQYAYVYKGTSKIYSRDITREGDGTIRVKGLNPATTYKVKYYCIIERGGKYYAGYITPNYSSQKTASLKTPSLYVTKLSSGQASCYIYLDKREITSGKYRVKLYAGTKLIKSWKTDGNYCYKYIYKKSKAGSKKYYAKVIALGNSTSKKTKAKKPLANKRTYSNRKASSAYSYGVNSWRPAKLYYSGSTLMLSGFFVNTHICSLSNIKMKIAVKIKGKTVKTKTISSGYIKQNGFNSTSFSVSSKKYDLRNDAISVSYTLIGWNY